MPLPAFLRQRQQRFRQQRMRAFFETFTITPETSILDVGGSADTWSGLPVQPRVTIINMPRAREAFTDHFDRVGGDACQLPFADWSFDVVFSNSVIEHVGDFERQQQFSKEIRRVGRAFWIQTPNRYFFLETHLLTPFVHFLPQGLMKAIVRRFSVWEWMANPRPDEKHYFIEHFVNDVHLLGPREMEALFPSAKLRKERWLGLTKSLIAWS
jgi:hypothetical protein